MVLSDLSVISFAFIIPRQQITILFPSHPVFPRPALVNLIHKGIYLPSIAFILAQQDFFNQIFTKNCDFQ
jgi:hypothetical protein